MTRSASSGYSTRVAANSPPADPERAASTLEEALSLWRGPALADLAYEAFAQDEIARLEDLRVRAQEQLIEAKLALARHAEVITQLEALIAQHPYREALRAQLMLALYRSDRQAEALQAYQDARTRLVEELGIEPGERLRELERAVLAQDPALAAPQPAPRRGGGAAAPRRRTSCPRVWSRFCSRTSRARRDRGRLTPRGWRRRWSSMTG